MADDLGTNWWEESGNFKFSLISLDFTYFFFHSPYKGNKSTKVYVACIVFLVTNEDQSLSEAATCDDGVIKPKTKKTKKRKAASSNENPNKRKKTNEKVKDEEELDEADKPVLENIVEATDQDTETVKKKKNKKKVEWLCKF